MRQDLGDATTTIATEGAELLVERVFDAPRELVWTAMTEAEHIPQWWGPHGSSTTVAQMDVRPGGRWRFVRTVVFDVEPYNQAPGVVETTTFEELDGGRTKVSARSVFPSVEILQYVVSTGMSTGAIQSYDRLADLLTRLR
ncbi:MAG: hypothetical protein AUG44_27370 [Actinobacteria bacterium 13_1_20CM_3_71_11]|nr:MAG: hypothetical protein AUG44_27370 [Actinobacteria bacterium 13_1_20CM_3_71_11]